MTRRPKQLPLVLPGGPANDDADSPVPTLDDVLGGCVSTRTTEPARELARRLHGAQGRAANTSGAAGEHWVDVHHARAVGEGLLAWVRHVGAPWVPHVLGGHVQFDRRNRLLGAVVGTAPPDYLGFLANGRGLVVEAKRRTGRLARNRRRPDGTEDRDAIDVHQVADLMRISTFPVLTLVVVEFERARETVRCAAPWPVVETRWRSPRGGPPSVGPEDLDDWRIEERCYLLRFARAATDSP